MNDPNDSNNARVVYLHELDSVRNSDEEICHAQRVLFEEIVSNGSKVVLSFNQLTDSIAFVSLIQDDKSYEWIKELFRQGILRVSLYGNVRTASQYFQNALKKCLDDDVDGLMQGNVFYFSALPVKSGEKNLLSCMADVLMYDDVRLLQERLKADKNKPDDKKLFYDEGGDNLKVEMSQEKRVDFLTRYLEMILFISQEKLAANPPKTSGTDNRFLEFIQTARELLLRSGKNLYVEAAEALSEVERRINSVADAKIAELDGKIAELTPLKASDTEAGKLADKRIEELNKGKGKVKGGNGWITSRSVWYKHLGDMLKKGYASRDSLRIAVAAVDVCYNLQVEYSIKNVLKHYHEDSPEELAAEILYRLEVYMNPKNGAVHNFLTCLADESDMKDIPPVKEWGNTDAFVSTLPKIKIPHREEFRRWATAARINENARKDTSGIFEKITKWIYKKLIEKPRYDPSTDDVRYEDFIAGDKSSWKWERSMKLLMTLFLVCVELVVLGGIELLVKHIYSDILKIVTILIVSWISREFIGIPEISDVILNGFKALWDAIVAHNAPENESYTRKEDAKK